MAQEARGGLCAWRFLPCPFPHSLVHSLSLILKASLQMSYLKIFSWTGWAPPFYLHDHHVLKWFPLIPLSLDYEHELCEAASDRSFIYATQSMEALRLVFVERAEELISTLVSQMAILMKSRAFASTWLLTSLFIALALVFPSVKLREWYLLPEIIMIAIILKAYRRGI